MTDIEQLIRLNIELEGLLKVLMERDSIHARSMLAEKIEDYYSRVKAYLSDDAQSDETTETLVNEGSVIAEAANHAEVKDQEAIESEIYDETDAATEAIAKEEKSTSNEQFVKAFTLNDKFRFRRALFNGDADDFDQTLALLSQMPSFAEAEDYLYNDLMWDSRREDVADFMALLKENMKP